METVWTIFCEELTSANKNKNLQIHCFVLMSNHFHLIASTPEANISQCMLQFMTRSSRRLTKAGNRINETFAGRHYKCILQSLNYYLSAYKYCYRNPVQAGLCENVEDYPFSTLPGQLHRTELSIPLVKDMNLVMDPEGTLKWLNLNPKPEHLEAVRLGLKRQYFQSKKERMTNKPILSENDIL